MSNATYEIMWRDAMGDLNEQLNVEGVEEDDDLANQLGDGQKSETPEVTIFQAFQHFACLYIKYLQILRKLEACYDNILHPQKRIHVRKVLELVIRRVIELKGDLVKWNPPNAYVRMPVGLEEAFPWEYVHLDDILVDLKLSPTTLEVPVPKYFKEEKMQQQEQRNRLVSGYMRLKHQTDGIFIEDKFESPLGLDSMTIDDAIEVIQKNERGRQGAERAAIYRSNRDKEKQSRIYDTNADDTDMDVDVAATNLQRIGKGYISRRVAMREREDELMFVGMRPREDNYDSLSKEVNMAYLKRKQEQVENREGYEKALEDLKDVIIDEEGPDKRDQFREDRTLWITNQIAQEKFPEDLNDFYVSKLPPIEEKESKAEKKDKGDKKGSGGSKEDKKKSKKGVVKAPVESEMVAMPKLQGKTDLTEQMSKMCQSFQDVWNDEDDTGNYQQRHNIDQAKAVVRPGVYEEIRKQVDEMLAMNLKKIQMQIAPKTKKKSKKTKKKKAKKSKKDKKKKPLPGEKIAELKGLDSDQILSMLIENQLVVRGRQRKLESFIGDFNYLGSIHHNADRKDEGAWEPQDPALSYLRQAVTEYCVLPIGSNDIRAAVDPEKAIKSIMFYGPSGTGKTLAVEAVSHELGALLIHLTPDKLRGQYPGKSGPTKLVHMVMTVARDPTMQPVIIYIDECDQFFTGGKKGKDKDGPSRFKKDLLLYKNLALGPEHRVIVIGTTKEPELGDLKEMKTFFDKFLYFPYPDYSSRRLVLRYYLENQICEGLQHMEKEKKYTVPGAPLEEETSVKIRQALQTVDISSLAHISEGYSAGALARTVRAIVTRRRVTMLKQRPLCTTDFIDNLSLQDVTYKDDKLTFLGFTRAVTGLDERRRKIEAIVSGEPETKKGDKKDLKGKKK